MFSVTLLKRIQILRGPKWYNVLKTKSDHNDCRETGGWLFSWKCWFCIILIKAHDRKDSAAVVSADQWKCTKLPEFLTKCCLYIYNANETSLLYCAALDASLMCSCIWFKESSGLCNFVVLFKHVRN
jgi:hypothetical protein